MPHCGGITLYAPLNCPNTHISILHRSKDGKGKAKIKKRDVTPFIYMPCLSPFLLLQVRPNGNTMNPLMVARTWKKGKGRTLRGRASLAKGEAPAPAKGAGRQLEEQPEWMASQDQCMGVGGWGEASPK